MRFPPCVSTSRSHKDKFPQASEAAESHGSVPKTHRSFTQTASAAGGPLLSPSPPLPPQIMGLAFPQIQGSVPSPGGAARGQGLHPQPPPESRGSAGTKRRGWKRDGKSRVGSSGWATHSNTHGEGTRGAPRTRCEAGAAAGRGRCQRTAATRSATAPGNCISQKAITT